ncbi:hypothetical protein D3260_10140 [Salinisphaera sp. Q1T1-3]|nr:hypothetical protein D3260_10140 [Salinisphaera sp. Q1T1-3]
MHHANPTLFEYLDQIVRAAGPVFQYDVEDAPAGTLTGDARRIGRGDADSRSGVRFRLRLLLVLIMLFSVRKRQRLGRRAAPVVFGVLDLLHGAWIEPHETRTGFGDRRRQQEQQPTDGKLGGVTTVP